MADFYDMNRALQPDNSLGSLQQGLAFGQQQRDRTQALQEHADDRALAEADREGRKLKNWFTYTDKALQASRKTGDFAPVNAALRAGASYISQLTGGKPAPEAWDDAVMAPGWEQLRAKVAMMDTDGAGDAPTGFREAHMKAVAAGYQPGTPEYENAMRVNIGTVGRAPSAGFGFREIVGADTRTRLGRTNPRTGMAEIYDETTGDFMPLSSGEASLNPGATLGPLPSSPMPYTIEPGLPPEVVAQIERAEAARRPGQLVNPALAVGPTAAQMEGDKARARLQAETDFAPQQAQAAGQVTAAQEAARTAAMPAQQQIAAEGAAARDRAGARVEMEQMLPKVRSESERMAGLIRGVLNHPGRAGSTGLSSINPLNYLPGSPERDFAERLEQLKGANFLQAFQSLKGGGAITQVEGTKAEQAIARLSTAQSDGAFVQALQELLSVVDAAPRNLERRIMEASPTGGGRIIQSPDGRRWRVIGGDPNDPDVEEVR